MHRLLKYLGAIQPGPISDSDEVQSLLAECWDEFSGGDDEGMSGDKLYYRMGNVRWDPPNISFNVERHGSTVLGSSRAEIHEWIINVEDRTANCCKYGNRQLKPMQLRLDVRPMAEEIGRLIIDQQVDGRLRWSEDGTVRVLIGKILPERSAVPKTLGGRRKRFRQRLDELLRHEGWRKLRENTYGPPHD
jgi:hypothetical protein